MGIKRTLDLLDDMERTAAMIDDVDDRHHRVRGRWPNGSGP